MSIVPKETIEVIAQSIGISNLSPEVALALAPDVEYRMREIIQEAIKCMRHSRRTVLTAEDVDSALKLRNVEPIYGFASGDRLRFKKAIGHNDLFYIDDKELDLKDVIESPLPKAPLDTTIMVHWLAIEGVQPAIPENVPPEVSFKNKHMDVSHTFISVLTALPENKKSEHVKEEGPPIDIKLPVRHVLSKELQQYFDKITELILTRSQSVIFKEALVSLATDSGLHPLVPYFSYFVADEVSQSLNNLLLLFALMRVVQCLLRNPHIHIEPYLHQLMPPMITCIVAKRLGQRFADNHWELRDFSANLVASVCRRFGHVYHNLQPRVTRTLLHAFLDPNKALTQHYGAVKGLHALGPNVVRLLILPNLETYLQLLEPEMLLDKQKNEMKRSEAWRVYGALLRAAGHCLRERFKLHPSLLSPPARSGWKINHKVVMALPSLVVDLWFHSVVDLSAEKIDADKRQASMEMSPQPPLKKHAGDCSVTPMQTDMQNAQEGFHTGPNVARPSTGSAPNTSISAGGTRESNGDNQALKASAVLQQAWKEDLDAGHLLASLFGLFGESILAYTTPTEMSFFL